jgi:HK97 gp10 family phage protein
MAQVRGGRELQEFLNQLPAKMEANVVRGGLRAGVKVLQTEVKENVPVRMGKLKKSIRISGGVKNGTVSVFLKIGNKEAWYGHIVEFRKPFIRPALDAVMQRAIDASMAYMRNRLKTKHGMDVPDPEAVADDES